jgi:hypothetical protein
MGKRFALIGLVASSLLFCSAHSFSQRRNCIAPRTPPWAEQGNFRFIRWTAAKSRAGRPNGPGGAFSAEEKDVLTHIYDRDFEQMLGLLKQAEFNWIWARSSGWSLKDENENR